MTCGHRIRHGYLCEADWKLSPAELAEHDRLHRADRSLFVTVAAMLTVAVAVLFLADWVGVAAAAALAITASVLIEVYQRVVGGPRE